MSRPILIACFCVASLAACTRTVVREHVVEREPVVTKETVVERPAVTHETIVTAPGACTLGSVAYSSGYLSCQNGYEYRCGSDAIWHRTGNAC